MVEAVPAEQQYIPEQEDEAPEAEDPIWGWDDNLVAWINESKDSVADALFAACSYDYLVGGIF